MVSIRVDLAEEGSTNYISSAGKSTRAYNACHWKSCASDRHIWLHPNSRKRFAVFFHRSDKNGGWQKFRKGAIVSFAVNSQTPKARAAAVSLTVPDGAETALSEVAVKARGGAAYGGPVLNLTDTQRRQGLYEISRWKLEARLDDIRRYFFVVPELNDITTGEASYVVGRKGTGKTAIVQYISEQSGNDMLVSKLNFKNFPFNEFYYQSKKSYTKPNQYVTLWKFIIYSAACRLIAQSFTVDPLIQKTIDKAFPSPNSDNLGTIIGKWVTGDVALTILGTGVNFSRWFKDKKTFTLQEKVENLEQFIQKHAPKERLFVLFDELARFSHPIT